MRGGRLRHVITIQQRTTAQDTSGALAPVWADLGTLRAEVRSPAGLERLQPGMEQRVATVTHQVRIRAREVAVLPSMRVLWNGRLFEIVAVTDPDNLGVQQVLDCFEIVEPARV